MNNGFEMFTEVAYPASEFGKLPWHKIKAEDCSRGNWSFGRGGHGFDPSTWTISIFDSSGYHAEVWAIPEPLVAMFEIMKNNAADDVRKTIRNALEYTHE